MFAKETPKPVVVSKPGVTAPTSSVPIVPYSETTQPKQGEVFPKTPQLFPTTPLSAPSTTEPFYQKKECASEGEPILKYVGIGTLNTPTKCCEGLQLCNIAKLMNGLLTSPEVLTYQGKAAMVLGYCKSICPTQEKDADLLLPSLTKPSPITVKECSSNRDCESKYCP